MINAKQKIAAVVLVIMHLRCLHSTPRETKWCNCWWKSINLSQVCHGFTTSCTLLDIIEYCYYLFTGENQSAVEMFSHLLKMNSTLSSLFMVTIRYW